MSLLSHEKTRASIHRRYRSDRQENTTPPTLILPETGTAEILVYLSQIEINTMKLKAKVQTS